MHFDEGSERKKLLFLKKKSKKTSLRFPDQALVVDSE